MPEDESAGSVFFEIRDETSVIDGGRKENAVFRYRERLISLTTFLPSSNLYSPAYWQFEIRVTTDPQFNGLLVPSETANLCIFVHHATNIFQPNL